MLSIEHKPHGRVQKMSAAAIINPFAFHQPPPLELRAHWRHSWIAETPWPGAVLLSDGLRVWLHRVAPGGFGWRAPQELFAVEPQPSAAGDRR